MQIINNQVKYFLSNKTHLIYMRYRGLILSRHYNCEQILKIIKVYKNIIQYQMNRRIVYKEQAKCNFCHNWFQVFSQIKFGLNICQGCIYKALNTSCFKLPTPQGHLYQVYLARRNICVNTNNQMALLEKIDQYMHTQIRELLDKWQEINRILKSCPIGQQQQEIWKKTQFILKNDSKKFNSLNFQTLQQIREDVFEKQKTDRKVICTPLKDKSINMSVKYLNKSNKKQLNRNDSKKSIRSYRQINDKSASKINLNVEQQNYGEQDNKRIQCSPMSSIKKMGSYRGLAPNAVQNRQNRQFVAKMQMIKNNITNCLEQRGQIPVTQPLNILKERIYQAIQNTNSINKCIELVSFSGLQGIDMKCYLSNLQWNGVEVVKFVKVGLSDDQLYDVLQFIKEKNIQTLVLTSNNLSQESCKIILKADIKSLRNIYLGKNQIFSHKAKHEIRQLKSKYNFFL